MGYRTEEWNLTEEGHSWLKELLADAAAFRDLSPYEAAFVNDITIRFEAHQMFTRITDKQMEVLQQIENKVYRT